ncbi:MAG: DUF4159 domain-containing protein [bacterium]
MRSRLFKLLSLICLLCFPAASYPAEQTNFVFTVIKYGGGGDWYNGLSGVRNFLGELNKRTNVKASPKEKVLELTNPDLFYSPFVYINGHGNIKLTPTEVLRLRNYLEHGGFLFINDDYGLDEFIRREMKRVFPDKDFVELPFDHPIYHNLYDFPEGLPKIHEHHGGPPHGYGIYHQGRLVVFYNYNTDIADGWETEEVHHDPLQKREAAVKMGINIVLYALTH